MGRTHVPRHGTLQFWPRKRAKRIYARVRNPVLPEKGLAGFAGYKVAMTHCLLVDNRAFSQTRNEEISYPVTIIECPPLKVASVRFYKKTTNGLRLVSEIFSNVDKELERRISVPKKTKESLDELGKGLQDYYDVRLLVYTQPRLVGMKKKPELFEMHIGGKDAKEKLDYAKSVFGKEVKVVDALRAGQQLDIYAVTKGKGIQGPVKRFGVSLRQHKSEKTKRGPGSLGSWGSPTTWRTAHAGQMGFHKRMEHNKLLIKISDNPAEINPSSGFQRYGVVKNSYVLVKGSVAGPSKRLIRLSFASRPNRVIPALPVQVNYIKK